MKPNSEHRAERRKPSASLRLSPDEARVLVWWWGGQRAAARAIGMSVSTFYRYLNPEAMRKYSRRHRQRHPERHRASARGRYDRLRDQGLCTKCGKEPLLSDTLCWDCLNKQEERSAIAI